MAQYGLYFVCGEHLDEVRAFLNQFFEEETGKYNFDKWITFKIPDTKFIVNLIPGEDQTVTQNAVIELYCDSMEELNKFAARHNCTINSFLATSAPQRYRYHYAEVIGPNDICKIEVSFVEDL